ncbi:hypothetical protein NC652_026214 [Populus alba x Populus x berolinensis]|nr:hypothetical protein NC652_026214 [Populus alba x Populus x berolinensis]
MDINKLFDLMLAVLIPDERLYVCTLVDAKFEGLIAAASGQLDAVLQNYGNESKLLPNGISNGKPSVKTYQNGNAIKSSNGSLNGVYSNGNGVHH